MRKSVPSTITTVRAEVLVLYHVTVNSDMSNHEESNVPTATT
jgi:hypothetical protein